MVKKNSSSTTSGTQGDQAQGDQVQGDQVQGDQDKEKTFPREVIVINETPRQWVLAGVPIGANSETKVVVNDEAMLCKLQGDCAQLMQLYPDYVSVEPDTPALRVLEAVSVTPASAASTGNAATDATAATQETKA